MVEQVAPSQPFPTPLQHLAKMSSGKHARIYPTLAIFSFLTAQINPELKWQEHIGNLINNAPPVPDYLDRMGFPSNWDQLSVWRTGPSSLRPAPRKADASGGHNDGMILSHAVLASHSFGSSKPHQVCRRLMWYRTQNLKISLWHCSIAEKYLPVLENFTFDSGVKGLR